MPRGTSTQPEWTVTMRKDNTVTNYYFRALIVKKRGFLTYGIEIFIALLRTMEVLSILLMISLVLHAEQQWNTMLGSNHLCLVHTRIGEVIGL